MATRFVPINITGSSHIDEESQPLEQKNNSEMELKDTDSVDANKGASPPSSSQHADYDFINYTPQDLRIMIRWSLSNSISDPTYIRTISVMTLSQSLFLEPSLANYLDLTDLRVLRGKETPLKFAKTFLVTVSNQRSPRVNNRLTDQGPYYTGSVRHVDVLACPHFWLAASLIESFHLPGSNLMSLFKDADPELFRSIKLFIGNKSNPTQPFSWESQINEMTKMRLSSGCNWFRPIKDAPRAAGLVFALENGAPSSDILRVSSWGEQDFDGVDICRKVDEIPESAVGCAAGGTFCGGRLEYFMNRDKCSPSMKLKSHLFPFINEELASAQGQSTSLNDKSNIDPRALRHITYMVLDYLREVFLQDCVFVAEQLGPLFYQLPIAKLPIFKTKEYINFLAHQRQVFQLSSENFPSEDDDSDVFTTRGRKGKRSGSDHSLLEPIKSKKIKSSNTSEPPKAASKKNAREKRQKKKSSVDPSEKASEVSLFSINTREPSPELSMEVENLFEDNQPPKSSKRTKNKKNSLPKKQAQKKVSSSADLSDEKSVVFDIDSSSERDLSLPPPVSSSQNKALNKQKEAQELDLTAHPRMTRSRAQQQQQLLEEQEAHKKGKDSEELEKTGTFPTKKPMNEEPFLLEGESMNEDPVAENDSQEILEEPAVQDVATSQPTAPTNSEAEVTEKTEAAATTQEKNRKEDAPQMPVEVLEKPAESKFEKNTEKRPEVEISADNAAETNAADKSAADKPSGPPAPGSLVVSTPVDSQKVTSQSPTEKPTPGKPSKLTTSEDLVQQKSSQNNVVPNSPENGPKSFSPAKVVEPSSPINIPEPSPPVDVLEPPSPRDIVEQSSPANAVEPTSPANASEPPFPETPKTTSTPETNTTGTNLEADSSQSSKNADGVAVDEAGKKTPTPEIVLENSDHHSPERPAEHLVDGLPIQGAAQRQTGRILRGNLSKQTKSLAPKTSSSDDAIVETSQKTTLEEPELDPGSVTMEALMTELRQLRSEFSGSNKTLRIKLSRALQEITNLKREMRDMSMRLLDSQAGQRVPKASTTTVVHMSPPSSSTSIVVANNTDGEPEPTGEDAEENTEMLDSMPENSQAIVPMVEETVEIRTNNMPYDREFTFMYSPGSFKEIWDEFTKSTTPNHLSVIEMEAKYGTRWRRKMSVKRTFRRRKNVYDAIKAGLKKGFELEECLLILEKAKLEAKLSLSIFISNRDNFPEELKSDENES